MIKSNHVRNNETIPDLITAVYFLIRACNFPWKRRWESPNSIPATTKKNWFFSINHLIAGSPEKKVIDRSRQTKSAISTAKKYAKLHPLHSEQSTRTSSNFHLIDGSVESIFVSALRFQFSITSSCWTAKARIELVMYWIGWNFHQEFFMRSDLIWINYLEISTRLSNGNDPIISVLNSTISTTPTDIMAQYEIYCFQVFMFLFPYCKPSLNKAI